MSGMDGNKILIYIGLTIGGLIGGWLGSLIDHNLLGLWSLLLGGVGGLAGIWVTWKLISNL